MDSMNGIEVPDELPPIKHIDISNEEYEKVMNLFQPERSKREDLIEMVVSPEPDILTKKRLEQDMEFIKMCAGVNPDLLGCGALNIMET